jgi:hypothetical protein
MPVTDKLPPLAVQALKTLRQAYDHRGLNAFDEDATIVFHVIGWIIAQVCGRERLVEAMERLKPPLVWKASASLTMALNHPFIESKQRCKMLGLFATPCSGRLAVPAITEPNE